MTDVWVYIDESQAPHARGTDGGQPFWIAGLTTLRPIQSAVIEQALMTLRQDPDATANRADQSTLSRGYFHASLDSKNAHSALCRAIIDAGFDAILSAAQWFFDREDSHEYAGARLHRLGALLTLPFVAGGDFDRVHVRIARRAGSFEENEAAAWPAYCAKTQLDRVLFANNGSALPERFLSIDAEVVGADEPGIQLSDFYLWALQRAKLDGVNATADSRWLERLGLQVEMAGGAVGSASQHVRGVIGRGIERPTRSLPARGRLLDAITDDEKWVLLREIASDVHRAAAIAMGHSRIGHLAEGLASAAALCERDEARTDNGRTVAEVMEAFIYVCDTLPVYEVSDPSACARAAEKRAMAALFLRAGHGLWVPDEFSLKAEALVR